MSGAPPPRTGHDELADKPGAWRAGTLVYTTGGLAVLFAMLLLGDFAWSLKERGVGDVFKALLREHSQNTLLLGALTGALPALITMIVGPVVGSWSDRYRGRWGRRIPFLAVTAPIIGLGMAGLAYSEPLGDWLNRSCGGEAASRNLAILMVMSVAWSIFEVATIIANSIFIALINDTVPRRVIGRFFGLFRIFSLAVGAGFYYFFFDNGLMAVFQQILLTIAAVYVVGFAILCLGVKEGDYPPPPARSASTLGGIGVFLRRCFTNRFYLLLFLTFGVAMTSFLPININSFNAKDQFGVDKTGYGHALAITYIISLCLAFPLGWLADRFHPLRIGFIALVLYAASMVVGWFMISTPLSFKVFFVIHGVVSGTFFTSTAALLLMMLPRSRFTEYAAGFGALAALMTMAVSLAMGQAIEIAGKDFRIMFIAGGLLATLALVGWVFLWRDFAALGGVAGYKPPEE